MVIIGNRGPYLGIPLTFLTQATQYCKIIKIGITSKSAVGIV